MLKLVFAEAGPSPTVEVGPLPEICVDGETIVEHARPALSMGGAGVEPPPAEG